MDKFLICLMIASSCLAAQIFTIDIKIMHLSLYRGTLLVAIFYHLLTSFKNNNRITLSSRKVSDVYFRFYFFWFVYSLFTLGWVHAYFAWARAIFFIGSGFFGILLINKYVKTREDFKIVFIIMIIMVIFHNGIGWRELLTGDYYFANLAKIDRYNQFPTNPKVRVPVSLFANPNNYATFMLAGVFISYINFSNSKNKFIKVFFLTVLISSITLIIRSNSRANILGLIIGLGLMLLLKYLKKIKVKKFLILIGVLVVFLLFPNLFKILFTTVTGKLQFDFGRASGSEMVRLNLIRNGLEFLKDTSGFGTGAGNIEYWMTNKGIYYVSNIANIHSWWMEILVGYGIFIFIGYIVIYSSLVKNFYKASIESDDKFVRETSLGFFGFMIAFIVGSISSSSNISAEWLWVLWGIIIAFTSYIERETYLDNAM